MGKMRQAIDCLRLAPKPMEVEVFQQKFPEEFEELKNGKYIKTDFFGWVRLIETPPMQMIVVPKQAKQPKEKREKEPSAFVIKRQQYNAEAHEQILEYVAQHPWSQIGLIRDYCKKEDKAIRRRLKQMVDSGILQSVGTPPCYALPNVPPMAKMTAKEKVLQAYTDEFTFISLSDLAVKANITLSRCNQLQLELLAEGLLERKMSTKNRHIQYLYRRVK